jgi:hypothetical protein
VSTDLVCGMCSSVPSSDRCSNRRVIVLERWIEAGRFALLCFDWLLFNYFGMVRSPEALVDWIDHRRIGQRPIVICVWIFFTPQISSFLCIDMCVRQSALTWGLLVVLQVLKLFGLEGWF